MNECAFSSTFKMSYIFKFFIRKTCLGHSLFRVIDKECVSQKRPTRGESRKSVAHRSIRAEEKKRQRKINYETDDCCIVISARCMNALIACHIPLPQAHPCCWCLDYMCWSMPSQIFRHSFVTGPKHTHDPNAYNKEQKSTPNKYRFDYLRV